MTDLGYVVIEYNQASGQPRLVDELHRSASDAEEAMAAERAQTASVGRRERFAIASVELIGDPE